MELPLHVLARLERVQPLLVDVEHPRHQRLVVGRPRVVPVTEPPVGVLADPGDPALVHRAHQRNEPVRVELDQPEVQLGVPLGHAAGDQLDDDLARVDRVVDALRHHPLRREPAVHRPVQLLGHPHDRQQCRRLLLADLHTAGRAVEEDVHAVGARRGPDRLVVSGVVGLRRHRRQEDRPEPAGGDPFDLRDRFADNGDRNRRRGHDPSEVRGEPLDDVVVVGARVRHRQLVVVAVEREQRTVRVQQLRVDAVEVHVLDDPFGIARVR